MSGQAPDDRKMRELILLITHESASDTKMGAVKLNKALFHIDFGAYRELGHSVTGQRYRKLEEGPAPTYFTAFRADLVEDGDAHLESRELGMPNPQHVLVADREPDLSVFSEDEIALARRVLEGMRHKTGKVVSQESHELLGWKAAEPYGDIPYETSFLVEPDQSDIDRGRELAAQNAWGA